MINVNIVSRKLVKPCIPTARNLKNYNISFLDELVPTMYGAVLLFYRSKPKGIITKLEESLAKILVEFYPLAGRYIKKDHLVDCNDEGAEFIEAEAVEVELIDVVTRTKTTDQLNDLLPRQFLRLDEAATDPLLSIQLTEFKSCGGLAIGISISHRIFDAYSIATLVAAWSNASCNINQGGKMIITPISPNFDSPLLFPSNKLVTDRDDHDIPFRTISRAPQIVVKRFSFNMEAISSLRSKLRPRSEGMIVSRLRVVSALIAKALIHGGEPRHSIIGQAFNVRDRTIPPLPKHSCGNLVLGAFTRCMPATETKDIGVQQLVDLMADALEKAMADCARVFTSGRDPRSIIMDVLENHKELKLGSGDINVIMFTDCSKFGLYEADFGWGKPVWVSIGALPRQNVILLMDNKERDGIEAWVHLNQNDMHFFEQDEDIRLFTTRASTRL